MLKHGRICGRSAWISVGGQRLEVRIVALRLNQEQTEKAQRKKKQKASKRQRHVQADTLYLAGWVMLVTTLPQQDWSDAAIIQLYQARWQIELVFKRIKQLLKMQRLRSTTRETALATVTALLLGWALLEEESQAVRLAMADAMQSVAQEPAPDSAQTPDVSGCWWQAECSGPLSEWMLAEVNVDLLCQQIRGSYTAARYRACLPRLQRFLCSGRALAASSLSSGLPMAWNAWAAHRTRDCRINAMNRLGGLFPLSSRLCHSTPYCPSATGTLMP